MFDMKQLEAALSSPMMATAAGLLDSRGTYGNFGASLNKGLLAGAQARSAAQQTALVKMQMEAMQKKQEEEQRRQDELQKLRMGLQTANTRPYEQDTFPGEKPIPGLLTNQTPQETMQTRMGLLSDFAMQNDPMGYFQSMQKGQDPTTAMQNLVAAGYQPGTPAYANAMRAYMAKSNGNNVTVYGNQPLPYEIPKGYMLQDQNDPRKGIVPVPGAKDDTATPEQAGKIQMIRGAQSRIPQLETLLFNEDGSVNRTNITTSRLAGGGPIPNTVGQELSTYFEEGIQAITRSETGAAMPPAEVENARTRFQPKMLDSDEVVKIKWNMYQDFLNGYLKLVDPQGRFMSERFEAELQSRLKLGGAKQDDGGWSIQEVK